MYDPAWAKAIGQIESSNNYRQVTDSGKGRQALGKYQVMDFNLAPWTKEVFGREMTKDEFLNSEQAQDELFKNKFGGYAAKYGSPQEAASVWFSGRPMAAAGNASDRFGTTVPSYVTKFNKAMGQTDGPSAIQAAMGGSTGDGQAMAFAPSEPMSIAPTAAPDNGFLGQLGGFFDKLNYANPKTGYNVADALTGAGASMMALDNPGGASVLARMQQANQKQQKPKVDGEYSYDPKSGTFFRTRADGTLQTLKNPNKSEEADKPKMDAKVLKNLTDHVEKYGAISQISDEGANVLDNLQSGKLDLGFFNNAENAARNFTGATNEQSKAYADYKQFIQKLANTELLKAKGVQTEGDAYRVMQEIAAGGSGYNNETARDAIKKLLLRNKEAVTQNGRSALDAYRGAYGDSDAIKPFTTQFDNFSRVYDNIDKKLESYKAPGSPAPAQGGFRVIRQH